MKIKIKDFGVPFIPYSDTITELSQGAHSKFWGVVRVGGQGWG